MTGVSARTHAIARCGFRPVFRVVPGSRIDRLNAAKVPSFADEVEHPPGGFHGGPWDDGYDVEYTFYGLGVPGLFEGR